MTNDDPDCICKGNWRLIVAEVDELIGRKFLWTHDNEMYKLFGAVHGADDYYYGMFSVKEGKLVLASCVGSLEQHGYILQEETK